VVAFAVFFPPVRDEICERSYKSCDRTGVGVQGSSPAALRCGKAASVSKVCGPSLAALC
jgi:hypothetical protein